MAKNKKSKYPKLSEVKIEYEEAYCYCSRCQLGYLNDKLSQQVKCPKCGILMFNCSLDSLNNTMGKIEQEKRERLERFKKEEERQ